jgi:hypothetical protein
MRGRRVVSGDGSQVHRQLGNGGGVGGALLPDHLSEPRRHGGHTGLFQRVPVEMVNVCK